MQKYSWRSECFYHILSNTFTIILHATGRTLGRSTAVVIQLTLTKKLTKEILTIVLLKQCVIYHQINLTCLCINVLTIPI